MPRFVASRWAEIAIAEKQIEDLKQHRMAIITRTEPVGAMNGKLYTQVMAARQKELEKVNNLIKEVQIVARLIGSPDEKFSKYWDNYYWRKSEAMADPEVMLLPSGEKLTSYELLINELRSTLKAALRRIRNER